MAFSSQEGASVIRPEDFSAMVEIYKAAILEPSFTQDEEERKRFAKLVISAYRNGMHNYHELRAYARELAREQFSVDGPDGVGN
ncbi:hypothetical protein IHQ71_28465 [Rhizobium sp. TH2]|uniref:hypothetical protein n=1 Tax=Rhizobium sp. TH2 TaxID=2775403 RepID=UPI00215852F3|nr:hypothetical protein [Rhizobium sp. TH2]UVC08997.1 hypothetical protein IHQ71_28465 [Rhizobium sp. TH2]